MEEPWMTLKERLAIVSDYGLLTSEVNDALDLVRQLGNKASHDARLYLQLGRNAQIH